MRIKWLLMLLLPLLSLRSIAQVKGTAITVSGKVISIDGQPVSGASILESGTTNGTQTSGAGVFQLRLSKSNVLIISSLGYILKRIEVTGDVLPTITLTLSQKTLNEVVVTGYGTQKVKDITGAVAVYRPKNLAERPLTRVDEALQGQLAGVGVKQTNGIPGRALSIKIRGAGSITANNEPLYVIDGFPLEPVAQNAAGGFSTGNPLDNLNPNDIASVQVLKEASSAAIYGSRAANGVVLITTKRGQIGKPHLTINYFTGVNKASKKLDVLSPTEWIDRATDIINNQWVNSAPGRLASQTTAERQAVLGITGVDLKYMVDDRWFQPGHPGLKFVDWQDLTFRTATSQNLALSASGATESVNYYFSGNYSNQKGVVLGLDYKNYAFRTNLEVKPWKGLKLGLNLTPSFSLGNDPGVEGKDNIIQGIVSLAPVVEDTTGTDVNVGDNTNYRWGGSRNSPIRQLENSVGRTTTNRILGSAFLEYEVTPGLTFRTSVNLDHTDASTKLFSPAFINGSVGSRQATGTFRGYKKDTYVNENTINYNPTLSSDHSLNVLLGQSYSTSKFDNYQLSASGGFINDVVSTLNAAAGITGTGRNFTGESKSVLLSYFARARYSFKETYFLSASLRRDGSSRFGVNNKYGVFPSASLGWRVLPEWKLRASWGVTGNDGIGDYSAIQLLGFNNYSFGGSQASGQSASRPNNADLKWERSRTWNFGVDGSLLAGRISGSVDYYTKLNSDLLLNVPVPQAGGFSNSLINIGQVLNKGVEVELNSQNLIGVVTWNTAFNISFTKNKVLHLGPSDSPIEIASGYGLSNTILKVGEAINSVYVVKMNGLLTADDLANKAPLFGSETVGDPRYLDANGDGKIDANDRVIAGHPNPDYTWGLTNTFRYKGFDLSVLVIGQHGGSIYSLFGRAIDRTGQTYSDNALGINRDRYRSPENPGSGMRGNAYSTFGNIVNTDWLYSSDYYRVKSITLGYNLKNAVQLRKITARVYLTAENWFGHDRYKGGFNPDAVNTSSGDANFPLGLDYGSLPLPKSLVFGINLGF